ncbi:MAG: TFIIB-type zinc ribbon-containing protein [Planctomycetes bacterium]|nr:TFIIB-type zinc ribbon-containing protein [Planctomycetota bacterium]
MPKFILECPGCQARFKLRRYVPRGRVRCRACGVVMQVPLVDEGLTPEERARHASRETVHRAVRGKVARVVALWRWLLTASALVALLALGGVILARRLTGTRPELPPPAEIPRLTVEELIRTRARSPFPIGRELEWQYISGDRVETHRMRIVDVLPGEEVPCVAILATGVELPTQDIVRITREGAYRQEIIQGADRRKFVPPIKFLCFPPTGGQSWKYEGETVRENGERERWSVAFETSIEEAEVPAGRFRCLKVQARGSEGGVQFVDQRWYALGLGLVQRAATRGSESEIIKLTRSGR